MNNKGFMMAEVVVVSAIVLTTLTSLYLSYNKIYTIYRNRIDYYDAETLYDLGNYRNKLIDNNINNDIIECFDDLKSNDSINLSYYLTISNNDTIYMLKKKDIDTFNSFSSDSNITPKFKDYLLFLNDSVKINSNYVMVMENCKDDDIDDCKYAYLEVYDGYENE